MDRDALIKWIADEYGVEPEHPWLDEPDYAVLRHPENRKWFALFMPVRRDRLGLEGEEEVDIITAKSSPILIGSLLMEKGYLPAYHMNKSHWVTALLDGSVPEEELRQLIAVSFDLTRPKLRKAKHGGESEE